MALVVYTDLRQGESYFPGMLLPYVQLVYYFHVALGVGGIVALGLMILLKRSFYFEIALIGDLLAHRATTTFIIELVLLEDPREYFV